MIVLTVWLATLYEKVLTLLKERVIGTCCNPRTHWSHSEVLVLHCDTEGGESGHSAHLGGCEGSSWGVDP